MIHNGTGKTHSGVSNAASDSELENSGTGRLSDEKGNSHPVGSLTLPLRNRMKLLLRRGRDPAASRYPTCWPFNKVNFHNPLIYKYMSRDHQRSQLPLFACYEYTNKLTKIESSPINKRGFSRASLKI